LRRGSAAANRLGFNADGWRCVACRRVHVHAGAEASITGIAVKRGAENVFPLRPLANEQIDQGLLFERKRRIDIAIERRDANEDAIALIGRHRFLRHRPGNELGINPIEPQQVDQCDRGHAAVISLRIAAGHPSALPPQPGKRGDQRVRIGRARDAERLGLLPAGIGEEGGANELSVDERRGLPRDYRGRAKGE